MARRKTECRPGIPAEIDAQIQSLVVMADRLDHDVGHPPPLRGLDTRAGIGLSALQIVVVAPIFRAGLEPRFEQVDRR